MFMQQSHSRFNYLGEWHSHPSFSTIPSDKDIQTMQSIVEDPHVGANFLVLLVCKQTTRSAVEATAMAFRAANEPQEVPITFELGTQAQRWTFRQIFRRFLGL
jgi:hypothetical protein